MSQDNNIKRKNYKHLGIVLTENDADILTWVNMLIEHDQSPRVWIKAILIADETKKSLDAGAVVVSSLGEKDSDTTGISGLLYGKTKSPHKNFGWEKRGMQLGNSREFVAGSILTIHFDQTIISDLLKRLNTEKIPISPYIKSRIRCYFKATKTGENIAPNINDATGILLLNNYNYKSQEPISERPDNKNTDEKSRQNEVVPPAKPKKKQSNFLTQYIG